MKLVNWNIGSLHSLLFGKTTRAKQSQAVIQDIISSQYDWIGLQEVKIPPYGPSMRERERLQELFPNYRLAWRASQKPAKTSYAGTMVLTSPSFHPLRRIYPTIMPNLDCEGRLLALDFGNYIVINAYIPHYEYHKMEQHEQWMNELIDYLGRVITQKPVIIAGDLTILPAKRTNKTTISKRHLSLLKAQYQRLLKLGFVDAYNLAPNGKQDATWWAPNIAKQVERGTRTDFWLVSQQLRQNVIKSGPLDTGERRDHAPIMLEISSVHS